MSERWQIKAAPPESLKPVNNVARQRISAAFSPQAIRAAGLQLVQILVDHFENVESGMERTVHFTLINPLTDSRHLQALLDELRCRAVSLLDDST